MDNEMTGCSGSVEAVELNINNVLGESVSLYPFIQQLGRRLELSQEMISSMVIAIEEQVLNLIRYAYPRGEEGSITLKACWRKATQTLKFSLIDHGVAYNPKEADHAVIRVDRPLGAMGINLLSQLMDTVDYVRRAGSNVLEFSKRMVHYGTTHHDAPPKSMDFSLAGQGIDAEDFGEEL